MRDIKFRMYDRKTEIMSPVHLMEWGKIQNNLFYYRGYYDCEKNDYSVVACNNVNKKTVAKHEPNGVLIRRYELMQYTELKDKNGIEIYEFSEIDNMYSVEFANGSYILRHISNNDIINLNLYDYWSEKNGEIEITNEYSKI